MWKIMFEESQRELKYDARLAGREIAMAPSTEGFEIQFTGFNVDFTKFQKYIFGALKNFECDEAFYKS
jgi:secreted Zn-dependent insulinase-like peptidase